MLQEKIRNYIKSRESASKRIKTLFKQPCLVILSEKNETSPSKTIHQFQGNIKPRLYVGRNISRSGSLSVKFDEIITNHKSQNIIKEIPEIPSVITQQRNKMKTVQGQRKSLEKQESMWSTQRTNYFWKTQRSYSNKTITLDKLYNEDNQDKQRRISKHFFMQQQLNENQFVLNGYQPILNM